MDVSIGLYLTNLVAIDETRETFEIAGYLAAKWRDPRLVLPADPGSDNTNNRQGTREFRLEDLWTPPIEASNSISHKANSYFLEADRNGIVTYTEHFDSVLSNDFFLRKFPFDTQILRFDFEPFRSSTSRIQFASQALSSTGISPEQHVELAGWRIKEIQYSVAKSSGDRIVPTTPAASFQIVIERRSGFYVWKIFLPMLLMTIIPAVVFWTDPKEFLLRVPMTMLLSIVAFEITVVRDLPKIGYVTFVDAVFIASFAFFFLCIIESTAARIRALCTLIPTRQVAG